MELKYKVSIKIGKDTYKTTVVTSTDYPDAADLNDEIDDQILEYLHTEISYAIREDIKKKQELSVPSLKK
jgi:hypothetical protein